jgi:hypothetical protein
MNYERPCSCSQNVGGYGIEINSSESQDDIAKLYLANIGFSHQFGGVWAYIAESIERYICNIIRSLR